MFIIFNSASTLAVGAVTISADDRGSKALLTSNELLLLPTLLNAETLISDRMRQGGCEAHVSFLQISNWRLSQVTSLTFFLEIARHRFRNPAGVIVAWTTTGHAHSGVAVKQRPKSVSPPCGLPEAFKMAACRARAYAEYETGPLNRTLLWVRRPPFSLSLPRAPLLNAQV